MKKKREFVNKQGKREMTIILDDAEVLLVIDKRSHYKLGYPVEDVVGSHILTESSAVVWCSAQQEWV